MEAWFAYWPPANGDLYVRPYFDIQGTVYVDAHDHWYTCTEANLRLALQCLLYQYYWEGGSGLNVVNENRTNSKTNYWVDNTYTLDRNTTVVAGEPVIIYLRGELRAQGWSSHATSDGDFLRARKSSSAFRKFGSTSSPFSGLQWG
jgi:chitinase